jgi:hypothetical protein
MYFPIQVTVKYNPKEISIFDINYFSILIALSGRECSVFWLDL